MNTLSQILEYKIVSIIRGADPNDVLKIAEALHEGGIKILEVAFNSPNALSVIKELSLKGGKLSIHFFKHQQVSSCGI